MQFYNQLNKFINEADLTKRWFGYRFTTAHRELMEELEINEMIAEGYDEEEEEEYIFDKLNITNTTIKSRDFGYQFTTVHKYIMESEEEEEDDIDIQYMFDQMALAVFENVKSRFKTVNNVKKYLKNLLMDYYDESEYFYKKTCKHARDGNKRGRDICSKIHTEVCTNFENTKLKLCGSCLRTLDTFNTFLEYYEAL